MRKALEFPRIDEGKLDAVEALIAAIADKEPGTAGAELEDLAALYDRFKAADCEIYSVSCDTHFAHKAWHDASENIKKLPYPMLADPTHKLADIFDVYIEEEGVAERGSFVVNPEGKIVCYEVNAGNIGRNAAELLRRVQASQFVAEHGDSVCPARWVPGSEVLHPGIDLVGKL